MSITYYCQVSNPRANIPTPILDISTLVIEIVPIDNVVKRIYVSSDVVGSQSIKIGSLTDDELIIPLSANVHLMTSNKGCMYNPTLAYSMVEDTPLYLTASADVDGIVNVMIEIEEMM